MFVAGKRKLCIIILKFGRILLKDTSRQKMSKALSVYRKSHVQSFLNGTVLFILSIHQYRKRSKYRWVSCVILLFIYLSTPFFILITKIISFADHFIYLSMYYRNRFYYIINKPSKLF